MERCSPHDRKASRKGGRGQGTVPSDILPQDRSHLSKFPEPLAGDKVPTYSMLFMPSKQCHASSMGL